VRHILGCLLCSLVLIAAACGGEPIFPDGTPARLQGGFMIIRQGDQTTVSLGGVLFPRRVKVTTATPDGPVVSYFTLPSFLHSPNALPLPDAAPALLYVEIPDFYGNLYIEGELVRGWGTARHLQSPPLPPGKDYPVRLRAAFQRGDNLLIEDRQVVLRAGQSSVVRFDGSAAISVPLRTDNVELAPPPRKNPN
jgi:uncharacterized protein (TIGR03000 family)